jgi:enoyl-CoA hydratase/carnithine racemase
MTFAMYEGCTRPASGRRDDDVQVLVLTGAGQAFVAGTDISQFASFTTGQDGIDYELRISRVVDRLEDVTVPTVAVVRGRCVGGGLALAAACDLRVASRSGASACRSRGRSGNCLSMNSVSPARQPARAGPQPGPAAAGALLTAEQAHAAGFVCELADDDESLDELASTVVQQLLQHAPLTMWAAKQAVTRLRRASLPDGDDFVAAPSAATTSTARCSPSRPGSSRCGRAADRVWPAVRPARTAVAPQSHPGTTRASQ